jgi:hypothetical protein
MHAWLWCWDPGGGADSGLTIQSLSGHSTRRQHEKALLIHKLSHILPSFPQRTKLVSPLFLSLRCWRIACRRWRRN